MSNKIVPQIYRAVIDDVIASIKPEFDEFGVAEDVLAELQHKWENKVIASHVAEFEPPQQPQQPQQPQAQAAYPAPAMPMMYATHNPYAQQAASVAQSQAQPAVKAEPVDNRFMLSNALPYSIPTLPGPQLNGARPPTVGGQTNVLNFSLSQPPQPQTAQSRIPQVDGVAGSEDSDDATPPPPAYPRSTHPSIPQPGVSAKDEKEKDLEAIGSDLDDSEDEDEEEAEEGAVGESDIVFCTYDKVARVKNKWKCTLKDGMIHVNGRDYLFAKCTGEFEW